jgi:hypothetical protein
MAVKITSSTPAKLEMADAGPARPIATAAYVNVFPRASNNPEAKPIQNTSISKS